MHAQPFSTRRGAPCARRQAGTSLIAVLVVMMIVALLGAAAARIGMLGAHSARNERDYQLAWEAAETGLMDAEFDMRGSKTAGRLEAFAPGRWMDFSADCGAAAGGAGTGLCLPAAAGKPVWLTADLAGPGAAAADFGLFTGGRFDAGIGGLRPARKPRYLIEALSDTVAFGNRDARVAQRLVYRVTAMGFGPLEAEQAVVQTVFRKE